MENYLYPLLSGLLGGVLVAIVSGLINRRTVKTAKIIEKAVALAIEEHGKAFTASANGLTRECGAARDYSLRLRKCGLFV